MGDVIGLGFSGYRDFARTLSRLDLSDALKQAHHQIASDVVAQATQIGTGLGGVHAHVVKQNSIRATKEASKASVRLGGAAKKHGPAFGAEFGSRKFSQFPGWSGNRHQAGDVGQEPGYMIHEAIRRMITSGELIETWETRMRDVLGPAFPTAA